LNNLRTYDRNNEYYTPKPILINEDDNHRFDEPWNNYIAAVSEYASWGFFDWRRPVQRRFFDWRSRMEPFAEGFQYLPVNWNISTQRKKTFFNLTATITGADLN
jgi:hypothetical protein